ncbi:MAG: ABC transporter permease [Ornithinimicrobium sp.]
MSEQSKPWALVTSREVRVKLTDRNFLISTGLTLILIFGLLGFQAFMASRDSAPEYTVAVTSAEGEALVGQGEQTLQGTEDGATVDSELVADADAGTALIESEDADAMLTLGDDGWTLSADGEAPSDLQDALSEAVRTSALSANAESAGTTVPALLAGSQLATSDVSGDDSTEQLIQVVAGLIFGVLFYMASLTFGISIAQSVVEEKQSRMVEILAAVIPIRALLTGKVLGNTMLAFGQMALIVGVGLIGLSFTEYDQYLPMMTEPLLWYLPFFIAGFVALACVWAAAGALATRVEDLQSTTLPLTLTLVAMFVIALNLDGFARVVGSFVPVISTILMPMRLLEGDVMWWEPVVALAVTLAFCWFTISLGSTLYRRALMQTQGRVTVRQALKLKD